MIYDETREGSERVYINASHIIRLPNSYLHNLRSMIAVIFVLRVVTSIPLAHFVFVPDLISYLTSLVSIYVGPPCVLPCNWRTNRLFPTPNLNLSVPRSVWNLLNHQGNKCIFCCISVLAVQAIYHSPLFSHKCIYVDLEHCFHVWYPWLQSIISHDLKRCHRWHISLVS